MNAEEIRKVIKENFGPGKRYKDIEEIGSTYLMICGLPDKKEGIDSEGVFEHKKFLGIPLEEIGPQIEYLLKLKRFPPSS